LKPSIQPDTSIGITHWRRSPWAVRSLEKPSDVLGFSIGTPIPQLVVHENIRTRASKDSEFFVPSDFRATRPSLATSQRSKASLLPVNNELLVERLKEICRDEWGSEYPKPVSAHDDGAAWVINFKNRAGDMKPSTVVKGPYRRLVLNG